MQDEAFFHICGITDWIFVMCGNKNIYGWGMCLEMKFTTRHYWRKNERQSVSWKEKTTYVEWCCIISKVSGSENSSRRMRGMEDFRQTENAINLLYSRVLNEWMNLWIRKFPVNFGSHLESRCRLCIQTRFVLAEFCTLQCLVTHVCLCHLFKRYSLVLAEEQRLCVARKITWLKVMTSHRRV